VPEGLEKSGSRKAYYGDDHGWVDTPIISRNDLNARCRPGPLIVEEYDSTTVVRPDWSAALDGWNNIVMKKANI